MAAGAFQSKPSSVLNKDTGILKVYPKYEEQLNFL